MTDVLHRSLIAPFRLFTAKCSKNDWLPPGAIQLLSAARGERAVTSCGGWGSDTLESFWQRSVFPGLILLTVAHPPLYQRLNLTVEQQQEMTFTGKIFHRSCKKGPLAGYRMSHRNHYGSSLQSKPHFHHSLRGLASTELLCRGAESPVMATPYYTAYCRDCRENFLSRMLLLISRC
jgi:hypothetical protein